MLAGSVHETSSISLGHQPLSGAEGRSRRPPKAGEECRLESFDSDRAAHRPPLLAARRPRRSAAEREHSESLSGTVPELPPTFESGLQLLRADAIRCSVFR